MARPAQEHRTPLFCPRCEAPRNAGAELCNECGERLLAQGYCSVCESFWPIEPENLCPKHDIPLDTAPPARPTDDELTDVGNWTTVRAFADLSRAEAARIRLEAEGIPALIVGQRMGTSYPHHMATGGLKLQVPETLVADARILLDQTWAPLADEDDLGWTEADTPDAVPRPAPADDNLPARIVRTSLVLIAGLVLIFLLIALKPQV